MAFLSRSGDIGNSLIFFDGTLDDRGTLYQISGIYISMEEPTNLCSSNWIVFEYSLYSQLGCLSHLAWEFGEV